MIQAPTSLLEDIIAEESANKLVQEQQQLKTEMQELLESLRPGLLDLLRSDGFALYVCPEGVYVEHGKYWDIISTEQLLRAGDQGKVAVLRLFETVKSGGKATIEQGMFWQVVVAGGGIGGFLIYRVHGYEGIRGPVDWEVFLLLQVMLLPAMLLVIDEVYPKLRAYPPWKWLRMQKRPAPAMKLI